MTVYILGGGPAGLALAYKLTRISNIPFIVLEKDAQLGGLAKTVAWTGHGSHDLGPHKIFTLSKELLDEVRSILPDDQWLTKEKRSHIYLDGHYLPYPPSPQSLLKVYGSYDFVRILYDFCAARIKTLFHRHHATSFRDDLEHRVGTRLYKILFEPIALKIWANPDKLDVKLSRGRVQTPGPIEFIRSIFGFRKKIPYEASQFLYPKGGLDLLWNEIRKRIVSQGSFFMDTEVIGFETADKKITEIKIKDLVSGQLSSLKIDDDDFIFSTLPLPNTLNWVQDSAHIKLPFEFREGLFQFNDLILVFLKIDLHSLIDDSWIFVPDSKIVFHRLSEQESFDAEMTPGGSIICCEIMSTKARPMTDTPDAEIIEMVKAGLAQMGIEGYTMLDCKVKRLLNSYPVFTIGYEQKLKSILKMFDQFINIRTIGRQGAFNYVGIMDCIDIGFGAAVWLINAKRFSNISEAASAWNEERERTWHYPVLD